MVNQPSDNINPTITLIVKGVSLTIANAARENRSPTVLCKFVPHTTKPRLLLQLRLVLNWFIPFFSSASEKPVTKKGSNLTLIKEPTELGKFLRLRLPKLLNSDYYKHV
jgi:hypothetical protein